MRETLSADGSFLEVIAEILAFRFFLLDRVPYMIYEENTGVIRKKSASTGSKGNSPAVPPSGAGAGNMV